MYVESNLYDFQLSSNMWSLDPKDLQNDVRMKGHVDVDVNVTDFINDLEVEMEQMSGMKGVIMSSSFFYMNDLNHR